MEFANAALDDIITVAAKERVVALVAMHLVIAIFASLAAGAALPGLFGRLTAPRVRPLSIRESP